MYKHCVISPYISLSLSLSVVSLCPSFSRATLQAERISKSVKLQERVEESEGVCA